MLSSAADTYLASLDRITPVSTAHVERVLIDEGADPWPAWLAFHERYAGYVQPIALDRAVWGIVHVRSHWIMEGRCAVVDQGQATETVCCADVHPSYAYELDRQGLFSGGPADSFDVYVEQLAAWWHFVGKSYRPRRLWSVTDPAWTHIIRTQAERVDRASDSFHEVFSSDRIHAVWDIELERWDTILTR
ncbi:MAG: hypothetical protein AAF732_07725 [Pseudomonadota bacterium]